jgi:hypothetical protein
MGDKFSSCAKCGSDEPKVRIILINHKQAVNAKSVNTSESDYLKYKESEASSYLSSIFLSFLN